MVEETCRAMGGSEAVAAGAAAGGGDGLAAGGAGGGGVWPAASKRATPTKKKRETMSLMGSDFMSLTHAANPEIPVMSARFGVATLFISGVELPPQVEDTN